MVQASRARPLGAPAPHGTNNFGTSSSAGPDGMAFDGHGRLYVCSVGQGHITVLTPDGDIAARIPLPGTFPTNIAFDRTSPGRVLITEGSASQLLSLNVGATGLPLHEGG